MVTANELYPDPPARIRARVLTGPHEILLVWKQGSHQTLIGCVCSSDRLPFSLDVADDVMWQIWLEAVRHDPKLPGPERNRPTHVMKVS